MVSLKNAFLILWYMSKTTVPVEECVLIAGTIGQEGSVKGVTISSIQLPKMTPVSFAQVDSFMLYRQIVM